MLKKLSSMLTILSFTLLTSCASVNSNDPRDPIEGFNRAVYKFNDGADRMIFKPVATGYKSIIPGPIDTGISNFFGNIDDFVTTINDLLQFKLRAGGSDAARVLINSTVGLLGVLDVASGMGFKKHDEDFGQTLGYWGIGTGPYLMLPFYGPSSLRDAAGRLVDVTVFDPIYKISDIPTRNTVLAIESVDKRADLLSASSVMEQAALDRYNFIKESYFQKRELDINNGDLTFPDDPVFPE